MPVVRYFCFVGAALLALLFVADAFLPEVPVTHTAEAAADLPMIRIQSDRKWPAKVVFDTSLVAPAPVQLATAETAGPVAAAPSGSDISAKMRVREAFAQLPTPDLKQDTASSQQQKPPLKRRVVKKRVGPPTMLVAQQPQWGFFASSTW